MSQQEPPKNNLTVIEGGTPVLNASEENINIPRLREEMVRGMYALERALVEQAGFEHKRLTRIRRVVNKVEDVLFDEKAFDELPLDVKTRVYRQASENMKSSMTFLQDLHKSFASGVDTLNQIEKLHATASTGAAPSAQDNVALDQVKALIRSKLREKS